MKGIEQERMMQRAERRKGEKAKKQRKGELDAGSRRRKKRGENRQGLPLDSCNAALVYKSKAKAGNGKRGADVERAMAKLVKPKRG